MHSSHLISPSLTYSIDGVLDSELELVALPQVRQRPHPHIPHHLHHIRVSESEAPVNHLHHLSGPIIVECKGAIPHRLAAGHYFIIVATTVTTTTTAPCTTSNTTASTTTNAAAATATTPTTLTTTTTSTDDVVVVIILQTVDFLLFTGVGHERSHPLDILPQLPHAMEVPRQHVIDLRINDAEETVCGYSYSSSNDDDDRYDDRYDDMMMKMDSR